MRETMIRHRALIAFVLLVAASTAAAVLFFGVLDRTAEKVDKTETTAEKNARRSKGNADKLAKTQRILLRRRIIEKGPRGLVGGTGPKGLRGETGRPGHPCLRTRLITTRRDGKVRVCVP